MAYREVNDLSTDVTISLGGVNKKTGKKNPTSIEGYYLGSRQVEDKKKKSGVSYIYVFQTAEGNVGVWGKTDLDRKMQSAPLGAMTRATHSGMRATPNGEMYTYKVEIDKDNTIEVEGLEASFPDRESSSNNTEDDDNSIVDEDDEEAQAAATASAARAAKVAVFLKSKKTA